MNDVAYFLAAFYSTAALVVMIVVPLVNVACTVAVIRYAGHYQQNVEPDLVLMPKVLWGIATLIGGVFVGAIFYLLHMSTLNPLVLLRVRGRGPQTE